jgi:TRAP-type C4-dicarboxylate transport system permease small subunit
LKETGPRGGLFDRILYWMAVVAAVTLAAVTLSVVYEVVARYAFGSPTSWAIDFSEYALLVCLFYSTAWVLAQDAHIKIDIFVMLCPPNVVRKLDLIASLIGSFSCAVFCCVAVVAVWEAYRDSEVIWRSIILPKWLVWSAMPIGSFLLTIQFIRRACTDVRNL